MNATANRVVSLIATAIVALLAAGCVSVPGDYAEDQAGDLPAGRSWDGFVRSERVLAPIRRRYDCCS